VRCSGRSGVDAFSSLEATVQGCPPASPHPHPVLAPERRWPHTSRVQLAEAAWMRSAPVITAFAAIPAAALGSRTTCTDRATTQRELMPQCDQVLVTLNTRRLIGLPYASFTALRHVSAIL
jgi:hypothetical protein